MNASRVSRAFDIKSTSNPHVAGLNFPHTKRKKVEHVFDFCKSKKKKKKKNCAGLEPLASSFTMVKPIVLSARPEGHARCLQKY
jgi:hypothetical protein